MHAVSAYIFFSFQQDDMTTAARRVFQIEQQDNAILMKHLVAHSVINYFPYNARSEAHYLLSKYNHVIFITHCLELHHLSIRANFVVYFSTTLDLDKIVPTTEMHQPTVNFKNVPLIHDVTFSKSLENSAFYTADDLTHGRHIIELDKLASKLKNMLSEAIDYLDEYHLDAKDPDWEHGHTINRLQHITSYMDLATLERIYDDLEQPEKKVMAMK